MSTVDRPSPNGSAERVDGTRTHAPWEFILLLLFVAVIGIGIILYLAHHAYRGRYSPEHYIPVDVSGLYWHFVDIIWIFLLPLLYLIGRHTTNELHF